jgi:hypothetical protein
LAQEGIGAPIAYQIDAEIVLLVSVGRPGIFQPIDDRAQKPIDARRPLPDPYFAK